MITVINASAAVTVLEQRPEKNFQALSRIRTHDLCDAGAVLSQLSYQSHMRAVVYGLAHYMGTFRLGPSTVMMKVICPIVAIVLGPSLNVPIQRANPYTTALMWL